MTTKVYDAIVVGTGAGGGTAMKVLCEAGLNVLALNSGPRTNPTKDYRQHRQVYDLKYRGFGDPMLLADSPHQERYSVEETEYNEGPHLWEHDVTYTNAPGTDWGWKRCKGTGGKTNFWGRSSARFGDIDFKAASLDGFGEDWPVDYAEISPWFSKAERYMGVSSTVQNRPSNPDGEYLPPIPWRCHDYIIQKAGEKIGVPYLPDRCAQLLVAHNGHPACHYCGGCSQGCDTGSFFSPTWFTIPDAERTKKLTLVTDALVRSVLVDESGKAKGVAYVDRESKKEVEVYAKVVVLAASCLETAHIMLNSRSKYWPTGIANSSGQVGRNLCDHLYGCPGYGYLPQLLGQPPTPDNIAHSTTAWLPRWQNLKNPREEKFIRGYSLYMYGGCGPFPGYYRQLEGFGDEYKRNINRYYPSPITSQIQAPSLPTPTNYVDIDPEKNDIFGIPQLRFHFEWGENELMMWEHSKQVIVDLFKAAGAELWGVGEPCRPGFSLHECGVCRFGNDPKTSVTNKWAQTHDVPNLYICDASIFPNLTDKTTTRGHRQVYDLKFRGFGDPTVLAGSPHQERYTVEETEYNEGPHLWEHDVIYTNAPGTDWGWKRCKGTGGKTNFWGRSSARFGEIDFKAASLDGFGEDWPVDYAEISPWFSKAERYMGVASTIQNRPSNPDGEYIPPFAFRCHDYIFQKAAEKIGAPYLHDRCAQLTVAHNGHPACHYCGNCSQGCDVGAFFSPTWFTIPDAEKTKNLTLLTDALVRNVLVDENGMATGVAYVDRKTKTDMEAHAKVVVLAASCLETAHIMLNSKSRHWPTGIANSSGQLGRNLCDHLYGCPGYGCLPQLVGQSPTPDNVADSTVAWMPRWQNLENPRQEKFIRGYALYVYGGCGDFPDYYRRFNGFGAEYKRKLKRYFPAPISSQIQAPSLPSPTNFVDIDPEAKDIFGIPALRFHFQWGENELMMWEHGKQVMHDLIKAAGGELWGTGEPCRPGYSLHEAGVCRFGSNPKTSVTNKWAQTHDVANLYICDASIFPNLTDKTTTMPIVAFTMRTCDYILENFRTGTHKRV